MDIDYKAIADRIFSKENLAAAALTGGLGYGMYALARKLPADMLETKSDKKEYNSFVKDLKRQGITVRKDKDLHNNAYGNGFDKFVAIPAKDFRSLPVLAHEAGHATSSRLEQESTALDNTITYSRGPGGFRLAIPDRVAALAGLFNTVRGFIGGDNANRDMLTAAGISSALFLPRAISELGASIRGANKLREAGGSVGDQAAAFGGVPSHLYHAALPWLPILGKATYEWLKNR